MNIMAFAAAARHPLAPNHLEENAMLGTRAARCAWLATRGHREDRERLMF